VFPNTTVWNKHSVRPGNKEGEMKAYSLSCKDTGVDCPGSFTTESKEELIEHVKLHAKEAHGEPNLEPEEIEEWIEVTQSA
jgi:predicted small metal-binding protein